MTQNMIERPLSIALGVVLIAAGMATMLVSWLGVGLIVLGLLPFAVGQDVALGGGAPNVE